MFITVTCPECADEGEHELVSESRTPLVRCNRCGHFHRIRKPPNLRPVVIKTIVSGEDRSQVCSVELEEGDECRVDDHLVAECGEEALGVEVTSIESSGKRVSHAKASEITTLWTRRIEQVVVKISIHDGRKTIPVYLECDGEQPFTVGEVYSASGKRFRVSHIKLRDGPLMRKEGWKTVAHRIKRAYGNSL